MARFLYLPSIDTPSLPRHTHGARFLLLLPHRPRHAHVWRNVAPALFIDSLKHSLTISPCFLALAVSFSYSFTNERFFGTLGSGMLILPPFKRKEMKRETEEKETPRYDPSKHETGEEVTRNY